MTFKLLNLPYLALVHALKMIDYQDIITMSFCSSKMYRIFKMLKLKMSKILIEMKAGMYVFLHEIGKNKEDLFSLHSVTKLQKGNSIVQATKLRAGGVDLACTWANFGHFTLVEVTGEKNEIVIINHIRNIFRFPPRTELRLSKSSIVHKEYPDIEHVTSIYLEQSIMEVNTINEIMAKYPNQKSIAMIGAPYQPFDQNSNIYSMENVYIHRSWFIVPSFLEGFNGKFLYFNLAILNHTTEIIKLIDNWMSGEKYNNLKLLWINFQHKMALVDVLVVRRHFEDLTKQWNRLNDLQMFEYCPQIIGLRDTFVLDCSDFLWIDRKIDAKKASFNLSVFDFRFCVWE